MYVTIRSKISKLGKFSSYFDPEGAPVPPVPSLAMSVCLSAKQTNEREI